MVIKAGREMVPQPAVLQDLNPMVKAILPEPQPPVGINQVPQGTGLKPWPSDADINAGSAYSIMTERLTESENKEANGEPNGF